MNASAKCKTVTVSSHKDKHQHPYYIQKPQNSTKLATKKYRKENEVEDENQEPQLLVLRLLAGFIHVKLLYD